MSDFQFVGLDVSKDKFDVALAGVNNTIFIRNKDGFKKFISWLNKHCNKPWVCMESTGVYSEEIAEFLVKEGIKTTVSNPMQIKSFCRAKLLRNKNDILDAKAIANFAEIMPLKEYKPRSKEQKELKNLNSLLDILKSQRVQLENQQESSSGVKAQQLLKKAISSIKKNISAIEKEIDVIVSSNAEFKENFDLMISIPGIGKQSAHQVLGMIIDIASFNNAKQFAAFIGLSPKQNQSGKSNGQTRISKIGNPKLRNVLFMASLSASRFNPKLRKFADKLRVAGKAPKAILCAVARKLAHLIFGVLKNKELFMVDYSIS